MRADRRAGRPVIAQGLMDADGDIAALVYDRHVDPDPVLASFVAEQRVAGYDVVGTLQRRAFCTKTTVSVVELELIPEQRTISLGWCAANKPLPDNPGRDTLEGHTLEGHALEGHALEGHALEDVCASLLRAVERRPDLIVLNRFGTAEVRGSGLLAVVGRAVALDIPTITAVPSALFPEWLSFSGGLAVKVECMGANLARWWRSLDRSPRWRPVSARFH